MSNLALPPFRGCILNFQDAQLRQMLPRYAMPGEFPVLKILLEHLPSTLLPQKAWASCPENGIAFIFDIGGVHKSEKIGTSLLAIRSTCKRHQYHQSIKTLSSTSPFHFPRPFQAPLFETDHEAARGACPNITALHPEHEDSVTRARNSASSPGCIPVLVLKNGI